MSPSPFGIRVSGEQFGDLVAAVNGLGVGVAGRVGCRVN
jgi:hypothetical protein